jgi:hypothetical protein
MDNIEGTVTEILDLQEEIEKMEGERDMKIKNETDAIEDMRKAIGLLQDKADAKAQPLSEEIVKKGKTLVALKVMLAEHMATQEKKTMEIGPGIVAARTTKSVKVTDKAAVVEFLVHQEETGMITGFDKKYLRKIREVGLLKDGVDLIQKTTVTVKPKEV